MKWKIAIPNALLPPRTGRNHGTPSWFFVERVYEVYDRGERPEEREKDPLH